MRFSSGLSLLELLIALALFALISAMSYPSLSTVLRSWQCVAFSTTPSDVYAAERFIRLQFEKALPIFEREKSSRTRLVAFDGSEYYVSFVSTLNRFGAAADQGLYATTFRIDDDNASNQTLSLSFQTYREGVLIDTSNTNTERIVAEISNARFEYYEAKSKTWRQQWKDKKVLPGAVRLIFTDNEGQQQWLMPLKLSPTSLVRYVGARDVR